MPDLPETADQSWFAKDRLGLFVHWWPVCQLGRSETALYREHLKPSEFRRLADTFAPRRFDPAVWMNTALEAGMRYCVLTVKQHDGFLMWNSATQDYCAGRRGLRRDYLREFADAARAAGLKVGVQFSLADCNSPEYFDGPDRNPAGFARFIDRVHAQIRELLTQYGRIDILWFDGWWPYTAADWRAARLARMARRLQPGILLNDRAGIPGDIATPEQMIPEQQHKPAGLWESCMTTTETHWGWHAHARWKTDADIIRSLARIADVGGNLLLNVGPKPDGTLPSQFQRLATRLGDWLRVNGESIYGTTETICDTRSFGGMTVNAGRKRIYLHVLDWNGTSLHLPGLKTAVRRAAFLSNGQSFPFRQDAEHLWIDGLPRRAPDPRDTVIVLDLEGAPKSHIWARERIWTGNWDADNHKSRQVCGRLAHWSRT